MEYGGSVRMAIFLGCWLISLAIAFWLGRLFEGKP